MIDLPREGESAGNAVPLKPTMTSTAPTASATPTPVVNSSVIASSFVEQYFKTLGSTPHLIHRFYSQDSSFSRIEHGDQDHEPTIGQVQIHAKIRDLDYNNCKIVINSIDHQQSIDGSVLVLISGLISNKGATPRPFNQAVLLARQERGFYVRNDVLRFPDPAPEPVPERTVEPIRHDDVVVEDVAEIAGEVPVSEPVEAAVVNDDVIDQVDEVKPVEVQVERKEIIAEVSVDVTEEVVPAPVTKSVSATTSKPKTWAALVHRDGPSDTGRVSSTPSTAVKSKPTTTAPVTAAAPGDAAPVVTPVTSNNQRDREHKKPVSANMIGHLFVQNLPSSATPADLQALFTTFGVVSRVEMQNNRTFGFVVFEDPSCVATTLSSGPLKLHDQELVVEQRKERRTIPGRGRGRGSSNMSSRSRYIPRHHHNRPSATAAATASTTPATATPPVTTTQ